MEIVVVNPDIPWNTGNIGRTCVATNSTLHLIKPLGFLMNDRWIKRAGLDYWKYLDWHVHDSWQSFCSTHSSTSHFLFFSRFAPTCYWNASFSKNSVLVFGSETKGLPKNIMKKYHSSLYRIPTSHHVRSLNLSTAVGIVVFEAMRQTQLFL